MIPPRIAIIAGAGQFPFHVAQEAKRQGCTVIVIGIRGWVDPALATHADVYEEIAVGQLGTFIERLKSHEARQAIFAGKVTKDVLLDPRTGFDGEAISLLEQAGSATVGALLGAVATRLTTEGITLLDSSTFLKSQLCPSGVLTVRGPSPIEQADIRVGVHVARALATLDVGQTVVVKARVVVAVEALEGTDAAVQRAHALAGDPLVVVKTAAAQQDRRFDLPVIGRRTIETFKAAGVSCLAMEAGATLLLDREHVIEDADAAKICLEGIVVPPG